MVGPVEDGMFYCLGKEHGYCDRRSGTCFCNVGYQGISCQDCSSTHYAEGGLCYPKLVRYQHQQIVPTTWKIFTKYQHCTLFHQCFVEEKGTLAEDFEITTTATITTAITITIMISPMYFPRVSNALITLSCLFLHNSAHICESFARAIAAEQARATTRTAPVRVCRTAWGTIAHRPTVRRCLALNAPSAPLMGVRRAKAVTTWTMQGERLIASRATDTILDAQGGRCLHTECIGRE